MQKIKTLTQSVLGRLRQSGRGFLLSVALLGGGGNPAGAEIIVPGDLILGRQKESQQPSFVPQSKPATKGAIVPRQSAPEKAGAITFRLNGIQVKGSTVFPQGAFDDIWKDWVGQTIPVSRLYELANEVTARYADRGYALSFATVPEQKIEKGIVVLAVVEGFVDKVDFTGDGSAGLLGLDRGEGATGALIHRMTEKILASRPLRQDDLERAMLLMNDIPGLTASATFSASPDTPHASHLTIEMTRKPVEARASANNRMSKDVSRWDVASALDINGLFYIGDSLSFDAHCSRSGCDDSHDALVRWSGMSGAQGVKMQVSYTHSESRPKRGFLAPLEFRGWSSRVFLGSDYPVIRSRSQSLSIGSGLEVTDSKTQTFLGLLTRDKTTGLDVHGLYDVVDGWGAGNVVFVKLTQGLDLLNATRDDDPLKSRLHGSARYTNLFVNYNRVQPLYKITPFLSRSSLYVEGRGQIALSHQLLRTVQCSYGGAVIGRGYNSGVIGGDHCAMGLVEARHDVELLSVPIQAYGFVDVGKAWIKGELVDDEPRSQSAGSTGVGLRVTQDDWLDGDIQLAFPLRRAFSEDQKGKPRVFVTLRVVY